MCYQLNHFCRNAGDDGIGRDVFGDYGSGGNDGVFADGDTLQDSYVCTEPHAFANVYWFGCHACPLRRVRDMIERAERGVMTDEGIVVNEDTTLVLKLTAHVDEHPLADMRVLAAIGIERRKHTE